MYEEIYISTNLYQKCLQQESTRCDPQYKISMGTKFNDSYKSVACRTISLPKFQWFLQQIYRYS